MKMSQYIYGCLNQTDAASSFPDPLANDFKRHVSQMMFQDVNDDLLYLTSHQIKQRVWWSVLQGSNASMQVSEKKPCRSLGLCERKRLIGSSRKMLLTKLQKQIIQSTFLPVLDYGDIIHLSKCVGIILLYKEFLPHCYATITHF